MSKQDQVGDKEVDVNDETERPDSEEVVVAEVDIANPIKPEGNVDNATTENVGETIESGEKELSEELLLQESLAEASEADHIDALQKVSFSTPEPMIVGSFEHIIGLDETARYARTAEGDKLVEDDSDEPALAAEQDRADNEYDDEQGVYAMPLTPDSSLDQELPADRAVSDELDVAEAGPPCPDVPPPPELFLEAERDELRTPPLESTLPNVLNLVWSFGQNRNIPVINLTTERFEKIFYVCGHTGIVFDFESNLQTVLQGHSNDISCTCASANKRWLVTADKGRDSLVIVWDSYNGVPTKTIFDAHADGGVAAVAFTYDARFLATLSAATVQTLAIWDWTTESDSPVCTAELRPVYGLQTYINFYQDDFTQLVTNSENQVIFYSWKGGIIEYYAPPLSDEDFNRPVGKFAQTIYLSESPRALTATSNGNIVIWETNKIAPGKLSNRVADKRALKIVRVQDAGINVLTRTDSFIVTGDSHGHIRFFDQSLLLVNWYQDFHLGSINCISFAYLTTFTARDTAGRNYPPDATIKARPFAVLDFVVGTNNAIFASVTVDGTDVKIISRDFESAVHALATHPSVPVLAAGSHNGLLKLWQYKKRSVDFISMAYGSNSSLVVIVSRSFERSQSIRCCTFDPLGQILAVGFGSGVIRLVDGLSLEDVTPQPLRYAHDAITHISFSHDGAYLASADASFAISVFTKANNLNQPYVILGRYRSHYKPIRDLCFGIKLDSDVPRLMSISEDRFLVEYDLENSTPDNLRLLSTDRVEQSAVPQCLMLYPPIMKESFILMANDQYKFKLYNSTTKMCRKTVLGPTYGSPLQKIALLPNSNELQDKYYMAYAIRDKVGLIILPLDGNPHNSSAVISHPRGISNIAISSDAQYLFTSGGADASIHMWTINLRALEVQSRLGGEDLFPFYGLLDGGREGPLFRELEDLFYYAQIRSQGMDSQETREVKDTILISEIPFIMRALGFYPTEQEIEEMLNEVKFGNYVETGELMTTVDLGTFIKLYVNHRPAFGLSMDKLRWAFEVLGYKTDNNSYAIDRSHLLDILQNYGENMTEQELSEQLSTLVGLNPEGGSCEHDNLELEDIDDVLDKALPEEVTLEMFTEEFLGLRNCPPSPRPSHAVDKEDKAVITT